MERWSIRPKRRNQYEKDHVRFVPSADNCDAEAMSAHTPKADIGWSESCLNSRGHKRRWHRNAPALAVSKPRPYRVGQGRSDRSEIF